MKKLCLLFSTGMLLVLAAVCAISTAFFMPKNTKLCAVEAAVQAPLNGEWQGVSWTLNADTGTLFIDGTGEIAGFDDADEIYAWHHHKQQIKSLVISDTITAIGINAFYACPNLSEVTIGSGVTVIGKSAFQDCLSLRFVRVPDSVQLIERSAFQGSGVWQVTLGNGLENIGKFAFRGCGNLKEVHIPDSVIKIAVQSFADCSSLQTITIGNRLTEIPEKAFENCVALQTLRLGDSVQTIGKSAFYGCPLLQELYLNDSVTTVCQNAFYSCQSLRTLWIGTGLETIENNAFYFGANGGKFSVVYVHAPAIAIGLANETVFDGLAKHVLTFAIAEHLPTHTYLQETFAQREDITYKQTAYKVYTETGHWHDWESYQMVSSSCTQAGFIGERCQVCLLIKGEETFAHSFIYQPKDMQTHLQICSVCGQENAFVHSWDDGTQTLAPTHLITGRLQYECTQCGIIDIQALPALDEHEYGEWQVTKPAACTAQGESTRVCPCGDTQTQPIFALGHSYIATVTPPTCEQNGYATQVCERCQHTYQDSTYPATGHTYTDQNDTTCNACGATRSPLPPSVDGANNSNAGDAPDTPDTDENTQTPNAGDTSANPQTPDTDENPQTPNAGDAPDTSDAPSNTDDIPKQNTVIQSVSLSDKDLRKIVIIGAVSAACTMAFLCFCCGLVFFAVRKIKKNRQEEKEDEKSTIQKL